MSGAIRPLLLYALVTWTGKTLPSTYFFTQAVRVVGLGGEIRTPDLPARSKKSYSDLADNVSGNLYECIYK
jgi:hypothetical protein